MYKNFSRDCRSTTVNKLTRGTNIYEELPIPRGNLVHGFCCSVSIKQKTCKKIWYLYFAFYPKLLNSDINGLPLRKKALLFFTHRYSIGITVTYNQNLCICIKIFESWSVAIKKNWLLWAGQTIKPSFNQFLSVSLCNNRQPVVAGLNQF